MGTINGGLKLVGFKNFVRSNPKTDRIPPTKFHHIEFWCSDATNTSGRFQNALLMPLNAKSDLSTGNSVYSSYVLRSHDLIFAFTAPYLVNFSGNMSRNMPLPYFKPAEAREFVEAMGWESGLSGFWFLMLLRPSGRAWKAGRFQ
ncbi:hypothetical protein AMTR_s00032p00156270 [Amborella trichopoda]|uniref:4-hydroxyphenylpyruvate dioxygenase n=1 Tax=Amborella trichopoda TaxID=13333 RepID=U5CNY3_AMBTC|nr:hypothetical protein AMTR_s00032p00156270 [Amborella trichopoda]